MPCGNSRTIQQINQALREPDNRQDGVIVAKDDLLPYWLEMKVKNNKLTREEADQIWERVNNGSWPASPEARERVEGLMVDMLSNASPAMDAGKAAKLMKDFRGWGQYYEKVYEGRRYVIFKGNQRVRSIFKGTRYAANNTRLLSFGVGRVGVDDALKKGGVLTVSLLVPFRIFQYVYNDRKTFVWLAGTLATDLIKVGISGLIMSVIGVGAVKVSSTVVGPIAIVALAGFGVSWTLDSIDTQLGLTDRLTEEMEATLSKTANNLASTLARLERAPCQIQRGTKQAANEAIDSLAQMTWRYFKRTGREFIDELVREQNYPGLFYQVVR